MFVSLSLSPSLSVSLSLLCLSVFDSPSLTPSLPLCEQELKGQLSELQHQERAVSELKERVERAEAEIRDKDAQFERVQAEMQRRLLQQQQLLVKNRK